MAAPLDSLAALIRGSTSEGAAAAQCKNRAPYLTANAFKQVGPTRTPPIKTVEGEISPFDKNELYGSCICGSEGDVPCFVEHCPRFAGILCHANLTIVKHARLTPEHPHWLT